jgi:hypothetical protein
MCRAAGTGLPGRLVETGSVMKIRRPMAAVLTALALFGGGATLSACSDPASGEVNDGTTDDGDNTSGNENDDDGGEQLPDNTDQDNTEDENDDDSDPD